MKIEIKHDFLKLMMRMDDLARKQVPFASAVALTRTAKTAQVAVIAQLPSQFTIRSGWVAKGIRITPAKKAQWPAPFAVVGSKDPFMRLQEVGGDKQSKGKLMGVPIRARTTPMTRLTPSRWPGALGRNKRYFFQATRSGVEALWIRTKGQPTRLVYVLKSSVHIKPRWHLHDTVNKTSGAVYGMEFTRAMAQAMSSAKK